MVGFCVAFIGCNDTISRYRKNNGFANDLHCSCFRSHGASCGISANSTRCSSRDDILTFAIVVNSSILATVGIGYVKCLTLHERNGVCALCFVQTCQSDDRNVGIVTGNCYFDVVNIDNRPVASIHQVNTTDIHIGIFCQSLCTSLVYGTVKII